MRLHTIRMQWEYEASRLLLGPGKVARGDGGDRGALTPLHAGDHFLEAYVGGAEYSDAKLG